jgi:hypothetical protein
MYWHVDDVPTTFDRLLSMGATQYEATPAGRRRRRSASGIG